MTLLRKLTSLLEVLLMLWLLLNYPQIASADVDCSSVTEIPVSECEALVIFYNSTGGESWFYSGYWLHTNAPCGWYGVSCSGGHVTRLDLHDNQLQGSIPAELGNLANLQILDLWINQLEGDIPIELGNLSNLEYLGLSYNHLSGGIPPELANLTNLEQLYLNDNQLTGNIPSELFDLPYLLEQQLCHNYLDAADSGWETCQSPYIGDFNYDGDVDGSDIASYVTDDGCLELEEFAGNFGKIKLPGPQ